MKFGLVDRVVEIVPGESIVAVKAVSLSEEYLADHFPTFPVLPGVLMLESLVEAARWLAWVSLDFAPSMILLREARNVTYKSFVKPGRLLRVEVRCRQMARSQSDYAGAGFCEDREVVKARFTLAHWDLADRDPDQAAVDARLRQEARSRWALLGGADNRSRPEPIGRPDATAEEVRLDGHESR